MKKYFNKIIIALLMFLLVVIFRFSSEIRMSILDSTVLWIENLVPSILPMYFIIDLLLNYGLSKYTFKVFKSDVPLLMFISYLSGTPGNAKYIREFYKNERIDASTGNALLASSYSPNPLFVLAVSPSKLVAIFILLYIYISNMILYFIFRKRNKVKNITIPEFEEKGFIDCLTMSIFNSLRVLILILGIIVIFGIVNTILDIFGIDFLLLRSILELSNGVMLINKNGSNVLLLALAFAFSGLCIHAQIKSTIEDTDLSYKYFFIGRILTSLPILIALLFQLL